MRASGASTPPAPTASWPRTGACSRSASTTTAEYVLETETTLVAIPDLPFEQACFIPDAVSTPYAAVTVTAATRPGAAIGVWGDEVIQPCRREHLDGNAVYVLPAPPVVGQPGQVVEDSLPRPAERHNDTCHTADGRRSRTHGARRAVLH